MRPPIIFNLQYTFLQLSLSLFEEKKMTTLKPIAFEEALDQSNSNRSLLIGNGFSRSISDRFDYNTLFDLSGDSTIMKDGCLNKTVNHIFKDLETTDFEKVLAYLEVSYKVMKSYEKSEGTPQINNISSSIEADIEHIKKIFINTINYVHEDLSSKITITTSSEIGKFIKKFKSIFTINYD